MVYELLIMLFLILLLLVLHRESNGKLILLFEKQDTREFLSCLRMSKRSHTNENAMGTLPLKRGPMAQVNGRIFLEENSNKSPVR